MYITHLQKIIWWYWVQTWFRNLNFSNCPSLWNHWDLPCFLNKWYCKVIWPPKYHHTKSSDFEIRFALNTIKLFSGNELCTSISLNCKQGLFFRFFLRPLETLIPQKYRFPIQYLLHGKCQLISRRILTTADPTVVLCL